MPHSRYLLWILLAAPFAYLVGAYLSGHLFYGEVVHASGLYSVRLLIVAMAATPLLLMFPGRAVPRWLMRHRRAFGVASFSYGVLHTGVYLGRIGGVTPVLEDAAEPAYLTGWLALVLFGLLASTSNDAAVRRLKLLWRRLHRLVYPAAVLSLVHWLMVAFNPAPAVAHAGVLASLEAYRVWKQRRIRATAGRAR